MTLVKLKLKTSLSLSTHLSIYIDLAYDEQIEQIWTNKSFEGKFNFVLSKFLFLTACHALHTDSLKHAKECVFQSLILFSEYTIHYQQIPEIFPLCFLFVFIMSWILLLTIIFTIIIAIIISIIIFIIITITW